MRKLYLKDGDERGQVFGLKEDRKVRHIARFYPDRPTEVSDQDAKELLDRYPGRLDDFKNFKSRDVRKTEVKTTEQEKALPTPEKQMKRPQDWQADIPEPGEEEENTKQDKPAPKKTAKSKSVRK